MTSPYRVKDQCYNSWEYVPTIISDQDSDLIGVRITRTRGMNYGSEFQNMSSSLNQGEDEEVADCLSDNPLRFPKCGFPPLCEQGDNIN